MAPVAATSETTRIGVEPASANGTVMADGQEVR
jgi:hypothetical protein